MSLGRWGPRNFVTRTAVGTVFSSIALLLLPLNYDVILLRVKPQTIELNDDIIFVYEVVFLLNFLF